MQIKMSALDPEGEDWEDDDEMRRVQFSNVITQYGDGERQKHENTENGGPHYSPGLGNISPKECRKHEALLIDINASEHDTSCNSDADSSSTNTHHRRDRRQSLAAQILMAPTRWGQQKDYRQRRMSLHGKPIYFTAPSRRKHRVIKMMIIIFNFLERPSGRNWSILYHIITFLMVFACLILTVFVTIPQYEAQAQIVLFHMEIVLMVVFSVELTARVWSAGCRSRYQGIVGRMRFLRRPFCIIDVTVVISSSVIILAGNDSKSTFAATAMRGLRFLQILRMVRADRRGGTWKLLGSVVYAHSKELLTAWYIGFLSLIFASFLVYQAEKDENAAQFSTFADALWWGLITLTTIGYGDKTPKTWVGRLIACCFAILGISFFALPAGILGSGFALKVQEQHRQKHFARRRNPAAYLLQCFWRCYAADADSISTATWQPCLRGYIAFQQPQNKKMSMRGRMTSSNGAQKSKSRSSCETEHTERNLSSYEEPAKEDFQFKNPFGKLLSKSSPVRKAGEKDVYGADLDNSDDDVSTKSCSDVTELTESQKNAIRGIRMLKFNVARRKFKEALRPYDVKDVIEQYSSGHIDMLARVKNLQNRVDCIVGVRSESSPAFRQNNSSTRSLRGRYSGNFGTGRKLSQTSAQDFFSKGLTMHERLINVENSVMGIERKIDLLLASFSKQGQLTSRNRTIPEESSDSDEDQSGDEALNINKTGNSFSNIELSSPLMRRRNPSSTVFFPVDDDKESVKGNFTSSPQQEFDEVFEDANVINDTQKVQRDSFDTVDIFAASTPLLASCQEYSSKDNETLRQRLPTNASEQGVIIKTTSFSATNGLMKSPVS